MKKLAIGIGLIAVMGLLVWINTNWVLLNPSGSSEGLELVVYTWDDITPADTPLIHIWTDNRVMWVVYGSDRRAHVYTKTLSSAELLRVKEMLANSGFWVEPRRGDTPYERASSHWAIWVRYSGHEQRVLTQTPKFAAVVTALQELLAASPGKTEYFPQGAYLFPTRTAPHVPVTEGFPWPDQEIPLDFSQATNGVYIEGEALAFFWNVLTFDDHRITSQGVVYRYGLKIPGVSCVYSFDGFEEICAMYTPAKP